MSVTMSEDEYLAHYGVLRRSGRYPWGSGGPEYASNAGFLGMVDEMQKKHGMSEAEIARGLGITSNQLRAAKSIAKSEETRARISQAQRLHDRGWSNVAIGKRMGINESVVRTLLDPEKKRRNDILSATSDMLKEQVEKKGYIDVGAGVELHMGVAKGKLGNAVAQLKEEGYGIHYVKVDQLGTNHQTTIKVLAAPGTTYSEVHRNRGNIQQVTSHSDDGGKTYFAKQPPISVDPKRVKVRYAEEGGTDADGTIYVRRGVDDLSMGKANYAQVRIAVGGTHYLKGMAMYRDDLPDGVDLVFNTNKKNTGNKLDAMKPMKDDPTDPFGAIVRQIPKLDTFGREIPNTVRSAMNIVNEEGNWGDWSKSLSSQMLSKQTPTLAKSQLDMTYERKRREFEEIMALTNPVVKKRLLEAFSDDADSSAVHLKAAALPRQSTHVILPINSLNPKEIYAPNYDDGDRVVLVRYPHGHISEIPELVVNNRHPEAKRLLGNAPDAVGIHHKVAERLSGADFDGDTVLVIRNNQQKVKNKPPLKELEGFDPQSAYKMPSDAPRMTARTKGIQMGLVSNLITDMHLKGAPDSEIARAVKHSMVVIDAEKHHLDWQQSARDNGIASLMKKYQGRSTGGADTIISKATSPERVAERKLRSQAKGGPIDATTGKKVYEYSGATYTKVTTSKTGKVTEKEVLVPDKNKSTKLAETDDAHTLSSGTPIERIYADHSNKLKALANTARKEMVHIKNPHISPSAKTAYAKEVRSLDAKLALALRNAPLERQAQVLANAQVRAKTQASPDMEKSEIKKLESKALEEARLRTGAKKTRIQFTEQEWAAVQAGAVSPSRLKQMLANADLDQVKQLATPKERLVMTSAKKAQAMTMLNRGYTQAEVAQAMGVSLTTLKTTLGK